MEEDEGGGPGSPHLGTSNKRIRIERDGVGGTAANGGTSGGGERFDSDMYSPYYKPNYKRLYPENSTYTEYKVFVELISPQEKLGNKSPIFLNNIFMEIKGVVLIQRVNAKKIVVIFKQFNTANNFLSNTNFLEKFGMKAYIPAAQIEKTGVIRFVPINISNQELYTKLSSIYEIIAIRRFSKKIGQERVPLTTVSITFLSNILPDNIQYDLFSYRVFEYIPPLQQCFKCFKFNHSAKICNGKQRCSICSGEHLFKDCDKPNEISCCNCGGPHLAISRTCPIKINKINEKKNKISYASVTQTVNKKTENVNFPPLPPRPLRIVNKPVINKPVNKTVNKPVNKPVNTPVPQAVNKEASPPMDLKSQIISNDNVLQALVGCLLELANKRDSAPINRTSIKDMLVKNLI